MILSLTWFEGVRTLAFPPSHTYKYVHRAPKPMWDATETSSTPGVDVTLLATGGRRRESHGAGSGRSEKTFGAPRCEQGAVADQW